MASWGSGTACGLCQRQGAVGLSEERINPVCDHPRSRKPVLSTEYGSSLCPSWKALENSGSK